MMKTFEKLSKYQYSKKISHTMMAHPEENELNKTVAFDDNIEDDDDGSPW